MDLGNSKTGCFETSRNADISCIEVQTTYGDDINDSADGSIRCTLLQPWFNSKFTSAIYPRGHNSLSRNSSILSLISPNGYHSIEEIVKILFKVYPYALALSRKALDRHTVCWFAAAFIYLLGPPPYVAKSESIRTREFSSMPILFCEIC